MPPSPHDALFKSTFSKPEHASAALATALPPTIAALCDFATLAVEPGSFIDADLRGRHTDLLYSVTLAGKQAYLYLLYEHQSVPHPMMPFRLVGYTVRIWEAWCAKNPAAKSLPPVVPVVLHHGTDGWRGARAIEDLYDVDGKTLDALDANVIRGRFVLDDLATASDDDLRARAMTALATLVFHCMKNARNPEALVRSLATWAGTMLEVLVSPRGGEALGTVMRYILMVHPDRKDLVLQRLGESLREGQLKETLMTAGEELIAMGEARGEARGLVLGKRALVTKLLVARFGPLPSKAIEALDHADADALDRLAEHVLSAPSLEQVFLEA